MWPTSSAGFFHYLLPPYLRFDYVETTEQDVQNSRRKQPQKLHAEALASPHCKAFVCCSMK